MAGGGLRVLDLPEPLIGYSRHDAAEDVLCLFNLSGDSVDLPSGLDGAPAMLGPYGTAFCATAREAASWAVRRHAAVS